MGVMKEAGLLNWRLQQEQPDTFSGLYIEHLPKFRIVVRFTHDAEATLRRYIKSSEYEADTAPRSLEFLVAAQKEIGEQLRQAGVPFESGLDIAKSEINVGVPDPSQLTQYIPAFGANGKFINAYKATGFVETTPVRNKSR